MGHWLDPAGLFMFAGGPQTHSLGTTVLEAHFKMIIRFLGFSQRQSRLHAA